MSEDTTTKDAQFTITRIFDAPREIIWRAWTDPDEAAIWWHPRGIRTPRESVRIDAREGGSYAYTMIAPDGAEYPTAGEYRVVTPPETLVFTWGSPDDDREFVPVISVHLAEHGDAGRQTRMTFRLQGYCGAPGDENVYDGWDQAFDLLVEHLPAPAV